MARAMTQQECEEFLAGVHIGVLGLPREGKAPLQTPTWYRYERGGDLYFTVAEGASKARLIGNGIRASLCVQDERWPYRYVTVEGTLEPAGIRTSDDVRAMATRYLDPEGAKRYAASAPPTGLLMRLHPERWRSETYGP